MKRLRWLVVVAAVTLEMSPPLVKAQSQQAAPAPGAPPQVLVLVRQEFQFGREGERARLATALSRSFDRMDVPNSWIDLQSITGKPAALSFDPMDSFAQVDDAFAAWGEIFASHPDLARLQNQVRALETSERTIIAVERSDLSYQAGSIDLSKAHFMRVLEVRVRPGHEDQFAIAFRALRAAYAKINADLPWVVYQVNLGLSAPAFLAFVPMHDLKREDFPGLVRSGDARLRATTKGITTCRPASAPANYAKSITRHRPWRRARAAACPLPPSAAKGSRPSRRSSLWTASPWTFTRARFSACWARMARASPPLWGC